jgi:hypothetical protein
MHTHVCSIIVKMSLDEQVLYVPKVSTYTNAFETGICRSRLTSEFASDNNNL